MNPTPVVLYGDAVKLEPLDPLHAEDLLAAGADPEIWRYLPIAQLTTVAEVTRWIDEAWKLAATGEELPFAIVDPESGRAIGSTRYLEIHRNWRTPSSGRLKKLVPGTVAIPPSTVSQVANSGAGKSERAEKSARM